MTKAQELQAKLAALMNEIAANGCDASIQSALRKGGEHVVYVSVREGCGGFRVIVAEGGIRLP